MHVTKATVRTAVAQQMNIQRKTVGSSPVPKRSACLSTLDIMVEDYEYLLITVE